MQEDITVSAEGALIEKARARARVSGTTLEDELQHWLEGYAGEEAGPRVRRGSRSSWRRWKSSGI